ncbi:MAG: 3-hydroxyacyl-CoA dehydrogenase [Pseudooceanicola sp.]|nr:3-hydroxyacyl-CoA dehydrogenase [Pseudooceanicola sp.]
MSISDKVAVIGAGQMGLGIVHAFALAGTQVTMVDIDAARLEKARAAIASILKGGVDLGKLAQDKADACMGRIRGATSVAEAASGAGLVIETATENMQIKLGLIRDASAAAPADAILASNTSALSITELAAVCEKPQRFAGMHFFNPVHKMKLVEIIRALQTSDETIAALRDWTGRIGKQSVLVNEAPGFTTSRISALLGNEAMWMLSEGVASAEDIDTSLRLAFNHPMGPLELGDLTGWDTRLSVLQYLHTVLGEKFRPCPLIIKMVKAGRYGRKVGHGVYEYVDGQKVAGSGLRAH